jgi:hypothetical protein
LIFGCAPTRYREVVLTASKLGTSPFSCGPSATLKPLRIFIATPDFQLAEQNTHEIWGAVRTEERYELEL